MTFFILLSVSAFAMNGLFDEASPSSPPREPAASKATSSLTSLSDDFLEPSIGPSKASSSTREDVKTFTPFFKYIEEALKSDHNYRTRVLFLGRTDAPEIFPLCLSLKTRAFFAALDSTQSLKNFLTKEDIQCIVGPFFRFGYAGAERRGLYALQSRLNHFLLDETQKDHPLHQNHDNLQQIMEPITLITPLLTYVMLPFATKEVVTDLYVNIALSAKNYNCEPSEIEGRLAQDVSKNTFLHSLWIENLSWPGFEALGRAVSKNKALTSLRFGMMNNRIPEDALCDFEDSTTLRRIILDHTVHEWTMECLRQVVVRRPTRLEVFVVGATSSSRHKVFDPLTKLFKKISYEDLCEHLDRKPTIDLHPLKKMVTEG